MVTVCFEDISHMEQAGQMRRDFVANVSHELRTPLDRADGVYRNAAKGRPATTEGAGPVSWTSWKAKASA